MELKPTGSSNEPASSKNNGSKSASSRNNNSRPTFGKNNGNGKVNEFGVSGNGMEHTKKSGKLSKSGKSKSEKMSKSRNLAKLEKKLSKNGNLTNSDTMENGPKFLTPDAKIAFNRL